MVIREELDGDGTANYLRKHELLEVCSRLDIDPGPRPTADDARDAIATRLGLEFRSQKPGDRFTRGDLVDLARALLRRSDG